MSGGKTKTSQTSTLNPWSQTQYGELSGQVKNLLGGEFKPYTGDLTADANPLQTQAGEAAKGLLNFKPAEVAAQSFKNADLSAYMDKGLEDNIQRTLGGIERTRQLQQVADSQAATNAKAWGGSRHGVADSLTNEAAIRASGDAEAGLRSQAFTQAANLFQQDANRDLSAQQFNSNLGLSGAQLGLQGAGLLGQIGSDLRAGDQAGLDRLYAEFGRQQDDPFRRAQGYMGLLGSTPMLVNTSGVTKQGTNWGQIIGNAAQAAAMVAAGSDRRIKENVVFVETDAKGRNWYDFTYIGDPSGKVHRGVMAQELLAEDPNHPAVSVGEDGFYRVNYGAL